MTSRVRNLTMFVVLAVWATYVIASIFNGRVPDAITWGVPAAAYGLLYRPWKGDTDDEDRPT